jgi:hypothetical protein
MAKYKYYYYIVNCRFPSPRTAVRLRDSTKYGYDIMLDVFCIHIPLSCVLQPATLKRSKK